jgi:hypothetical protein
MVNGSSPGPAPTAQARASSSRLTRSSCRSWSHRKLRRKVPSVDDAFTVQPSTCSSPQHAARFILSVYWGLGSPGIITQLPFAPNTRPTFSTDPRNCTARAAGRRVGAVANGTPRPFHRGLAAHHTAEVERVARHHGQRIGVKLLLRS